NDRELWKTDGTEANTIKVGTLASRPTQFAVVGSALYFVVGQNLFIADSGGARLATGTLLRVPQNLVAVGTKLYFTDSESSIVSTTRIWTFDTVALALTLASNQTFLNASSVVTALDTPAELINANGILVFSARTGGTPDRDVFQYNG